MAQYRPVLFTRMRSSKSKDTTVVKRARDEKEIEKENGKEEER